MPKEQPKTLQPKDFEVNRTWLAYRINQLPMRIEDKEFDLFILQDAASMFLFGNALAAHGAESPPAENVKALMKKAWSQKQQWPDELLLPGRPTSKHTFAIEAKREGIVVKTVPESQLSFYIKDVQQAFEQFGARKNRDDA